MFTNRSAIAIFVIAASIAIGTTTSIANQAFAAKSSGDEHGLDTADQKIHENGPGFGSQGDIRHHEGTCQGGHTVDIPDGCNNDLITGPGDSENHP